MSAMSSLGFNQGVSRPVFLSGGCREESMCLTLFQFLGPTTFLGSESSPSVFTDVNITSSSNAASL